MKVIISGGGTGGHIYPALAIARGFKERVPAAEILYVGSEQGMERNIVPREGFNFKAVSITGIDRSSMMKASQTLVKFPRSFFQAWDIIKSFEPDIIVGTGGYASFPILLAGTFFPCKTVIHEQNAIPGLANRHLARRVDLTLLTFEEAASYLQAKSIKVTGLPVRREILAVDRDEAKRKLQLEKDKFTLLAFGGSRGAMSINRAMLEVIERYKNENMQIIWISGESGYKEIQEEIQKRLTLKSMKCRLELFPYMFNIEEALAAADLAVCRAGASTISELAVLGLPAILIPFPYAAENHQEKNARALQAKNAARLVIDEFLDGDTLYKNIEQLRQDKAQLEEMSANISKEARPNALKDIIDIILANS
ncbi:MAG: undecaprenyldiphospho-muramoylpentapeptide beta-N-acetylglucosaminyltransferase [Syntrophomonas sp.]